mmetsp:Transcript_7543/g.17281  ORF Transcript_7543/g.17281 Transcript_7543/m.17281 type:complete len:125 (-) Transcript_7543:229-603(-)|eukprot:CAMPEP_0116823548 /NCGR_PEP_ID=MMETSP0418-20121206/898_1 /TAXON_ID=1158023 /ORGANISM="Astrosyne radiata, Strain 13vi08-1A" /LENGTH=124 /DNA_ID=CAMNT_0004451811 /DNA_START=499 /DNA_END=873 /DNA_ORIENTATION=+
MTHVVTLLDMQAFQAARYQDQDWGARSMSKEAEDPCKDSTDTGSRDQSNSNTITACCNEGLKDLRKRNHGLLQRITRSPDAILNRVCAGFDTRYIHTSKNLGLVIPSIRGHTKDYVSSSRYLYI